MSDDDKSAPGLESDDEQEVQKASFADSGVVPPSGSNTQAAATPSNTPVVSLYSKVPEQPSSLKRAFEGAGAAGAAGEADMLKDLLNKLALQGLEPKKAPGQPKNKGGDDDEDDDDDEDGGDEDDEDEEDGDDHVATQEQVEAALPLLRENQLKIDALKKEYQKARRELELKFQALREVHYQERSSIIHGKSDDGIALPGFWLDAMQRSMLLSQFIEEHDEPALVFLDNITCTELADDFGYQLTFHFSKNPFFSNETLTKTLKLSNIYGADYTMPEIDESIGCDINWFPEKNLCVRVEVKEVKRGGGKKDKKKSQTREVRQEVPQASFFQFFNTRVDKTPEEMEEMGDEEQAQYQQDWEMDFAIASTLRAKVIPDALQWYLGEAEDSDYEDDEEEDEDEEGEFDEMDDDDEDEDEDEDDDEDEKPQGKSKKGGKNKPLASQGAGGKEGEQAPECKQQ